MTTTRKRSATKAPATIAQRDACEAAPVTPLKPVKPRIGEGRGNLRAREEAFKRRRGLTGT